MSFQRLTYLDADTGVIVAQLLDNPRQVAADVEPHGEEKGDDCHLSSTGLDKLVDSIQETGLGGVQECREAERKLRLRCRGKCRARELASGNHSVNTLTKLRADRRWMV